MSSRPQISSLPDTATATADHSDLRKKLESIPLMVQKIWSDNPIFQFEAICQFRELLSIEHSPPIDEVVNAGVIPRFVEFLGKNDAPDLQIEATWALGCVASERTRVMIEHGAIPMFVQLLSSTNDEVREKAVWALGILAGDSPYTRDRILNHGAFTPLLKQFNQRSKPSMLRNATRTLYNFCYNDPPFEQVKPALPVLRQLLLLQDQEVLTNACWALSYLSDDEMQAVIAAGVCNLLAPLLLHPSRKVLIPALRTVGNIVLGDEKQTQLVIDNQMLPCLFQLLTKPRAKFITREACWIISNITAGNQTQIQAVMDANIILPLVQLLQTAEFKIKKEAAWSISNAITGGSHEQIRILAGQGCIKPLCDLLTCSDPQTVKGCLEGIENILSVGEADKESGLTNGANSYVALIDECGVLHKIETLQIHENEDIFDKAVELLAKYWAKSDDVEENITQSGFSFGKNQSGQSS